MKLTPWVILVLVVGASLSAQAQQPAPAEQLVPVEKSTQELPNESALSNTVSTPIPTPSPVSVSTQELAAQAPQETPTETQTADEPEVALVTDFGLLANPNVDEKIHDLLIKYVSVFNRPKEKITPSEARLLRFSVRKEIGDILATEGYFSPTISFETVTEKDSAKVKIKLDLGAPTKISSAQIRFIGSAVTPELQSKIRQSWGLPVNAVFRDDDWTRAKSHALESLTERSYPAAKIANSEAVVQDLQADLAIDLDSGPIFYMGQLHVQGLSLYKPWLLERYHPPKPGDVYDRQKLLNFQRELQNSPYFSSVTVSVDPDPAVAAAVPVEVLLTERNEYDVGLGAGYSSNTRARGEVSFRDRNFYDAAYDLRSVIRIEQLRQVGYTDVYLPPRRSGYLDSFGVLFDRSDISGLLTATTSFGAKRVITEGALERRIGLSFVYEDSTVNGGDQVLAKALVGSLGWTWRRVNNTFDPRQGSILQIDVSGATKALLSDQNFVRLYGKYQYWIPIGARDVIILRTEAGYVASPSSDGIPEDYLFRAGGSGSVRGYSYQSLGVKQDNGVVGGRILSTATAEYVHWLKENWGVAAFVDVGDAADKVSALDLKQGFGLGGRYKTPAGPIAIDLAYGRQVKRFRLDFSIGIAF